MPEISVPQTLNRREFAALTGVSERQVRKWLDEGLPATRGTGRGSPLVIQPPAAIQWLLKRSQQEHRGVASLEGARLKRAQADKVEQENLVRRGELVEAAEVAHAIQAIVVAVTQMLDGLGARFGRDAEMRAAIQNEVRAARDDAVARLRSLAPGPGGHRGARAKA